jgi:enoyl-[acyl-carrier-protein] reductase (NADH)
MNQPPPLTFPYQLDRVRDGVLAQGDILQKVASHYADAAAASVFLLTDASRSIAGEVLEVDAGWNLL